MKPLMKTYVLSVIGAKVPDRRVLDATDEATARRAVARSFGKMWLDPKRTTCVHVPGNRDVTIMQQSMKDMGQC